MTVDTLRYVKRLEAAGVPRAQAEAHAEALRDEVAPQLVTSTDLGQAVDRLENQIAGVEQRLEAKIETMMWKHTVAIILAIVAAGGLMLRFAR